MSIHISFGSSLSVVIEGFFREFTDYWTIAIEVEISQVIESCRVSFSCCFLKIFYSFAFGLFYPSTIEKRFTYNSLSIGITFFSNLHQSLYPFGIRRVDFVHPSSEEEIGIMTSFFSSFLSPKFSFVYIFSHAIASVVRFSKVEQGFSFFVISIFFNPSVVFFVRLRDATTISVTKS